MVVIADDLTGAADCAASSAALGCRAVVLLYSSEDQEYEAAWPDTDILSIDANSRCLSAEKASELTTRLVRESDSHNVAVHEYVIFKKIDSTLRGNVATEIAALLNARRSSNSMNANLSILMAPALPSQGRTTIGGRLLVHGVPLEKTDIWQTEARTAPSDILQLLADANLSSKLIGTEIVRSDVNSLRRSISQFAKHHDVVVCDAETDSDLHAIAEASLSVPTITALVGSAGLACQVPQLIGIAHNPDTPGWNLAAGPTLFVVGTAASVSRQQARLLEAIPDVATIRVSATDLHESTSICRQIIQDLQSGRDVLLMLNGGANCSNSDWQLLSQTLSEQVSKLAQHLGALVATGGETARAVLDALGIHRLRLLGEVEPGLPFSVADSWVRPLPVITKAGAFGSPHALVRCRDFLRQLERAPASLEAKSPLTGYKS
jgi:4-hydroxythreonine-4-phosphate dehydrogenase